MQPPAPTHTLRGMSVPSPEPSGSADWKTLTSEQKRARVLNMAGVLFAKEGVDFPMPKLAAALGIGVGSVYRQLGNKDDVLAELVLDRIDTFQKTYDAALERDDPTQALIEVIDYALGQTMIDRIAKISYELALDREDVRVVREKAAATLQELVDRAKAVGGIREDATAMDLRVMLRLAREAELITPDGGGRIADLVVAGLGLPPLPSRS